MWKPPLNFITLHYGYIITAGILGLILIYPSGNMRAVDAYFFGVSASTESGLNTLDVKDLKTYQQLVIYFIPMVTNLCFVNILVVVARLLWFEKRLKAVAPRLLRAAPRGAQTTGDEQDCEAQVHASGNEPKNTGGDSSEGEAAQVDQEQPANEEKLDPNLDVTQHTTPGHIRFAPESVHPRRESKALYVPSPRDQERGHTIIERDEELSDGDGDEIKPDKSHLGANGLTHRRKGGARRTSIGRATSIDRVASSLFVMGPTPTSREENPRPRVEPQLARMPTLSSQATVGRNSQFSNLTMEDREQLGGLEYRSLRLLLKIVVGYFVGMHVFGAVCLVGWVQYADSKYVDYLDECGQDKIWWAFYSAQTMVDNLGFTLTPDSMITFQDATFPLLVMSFLAYAGNTLYPVVLRLLIWTMSTLVPKNSSLKEPLGFLLDHPRRCYTLLFPSRPTWILFGILGLMNLVDVLLILVLDLHNEAVNTLPGGPRVLAAIFQAASARHTGTSTFNLADVHPAVQFSLLVMMYIAVYPIAISVRASNTYEEKSLGIYSSDAFEMNENDGKSYVMMHLRNQLSFDLWYIFLGIFCICIAESGKIMDKADPAFSVFPIFFEVVSAYGNVGLSLGHPTVMTSLCGQFTPFSKLVICSMMIRGRHRSLPYQLDRAILLPNERPFVENVTAVIGRAEPRETLKIKRYYTS
ncbi:putative cation transporter [Amylocarpus encephaloides]|uniref:Cation transporter n=1 Tax=Amylocarpus encephaloides TaxID=45428 RepID=A0A9P7YFL7_9HELO|nr:putative cation transporter [Amylocarpus encephaloides]